MRERAPRLSQRSDEASPLKRAAWQRYAGALAITLAVVALRFALDPWWGHHRNRHLVFLPTVMLAAWFGGFGAGVVSTALSTLALYLYWADEAPSWHVPSSDLVLFFVVSLLICKLVGSLQAARARADASARSRARVLEVVAHDLRSPLTAIKTTSEGMARAAPDLQERAERVGRAVKRMDDLIRDLVDTTRIEHGELAIARRSEPVEQIVQEVLQLMTPAAQQKEVALEARNGAPADATVTCDRGRIMQVLNNLIGNSLKFTPAAGRITLGVDQEGDALRFAVTDTGKGIRAEDLPHVFEQYWKAEQGGTGLGLYIAQTIVRAHGGRIWAQSAPGVETTFSFTLPRA